MNVTPTNDALNIAVGTFIESVLPSVKVVQGLADLVAMPIGGFVCFTPTAVRRLSTNHTAYDGNAQQRGVTMPTEYSVQIDCYGPLAADWATMLTAMWRDPYACDVLAPDSQPLYSTDPVQMPLVNGEQNYESRFTFNALLQFNPTVNVPQQSALAIDVDLISVDAEYPPQ